MGKKQSLSEFEKGRIAELSKLRFSYRFIAIKLKRSRCVIKSYLQNPEEYGTRKSTGRKFKLSKEVTFYHTSASFEFDSNKAIRETELG